MCLNDLQVILQGNLFRIVDYKEKALAERKFQLSMQGLLSIKTNATATDYIRTIEMVKEAVKRNFGIELELEVKIVGEEPIESYTGVRCRIIVPDTFYFMFTKGC